MKNKLALILIILSFAVNAAFAESYYDDKSYYTGDSFFSAPDYIEKTQTQEQEEAADYSGNSSVRGTTPPIKKLRQAVQRKNEARRERQTQLEKTKKEDSIYNSDTETSDFASKEEKEDFDENMMPDGFEADEQSV